MQITSVVRATAVLSALALVGLSGSPALAAEPIARASATALMLSVANNPAGTGSYSVTDDGSGEVASGSNQPPLSSAGNQSFVSAGTLAQDATTSVDLGAGSSAACSGLAGQGASLAGAGNGSCLSGGDTLTLTPSALNLTQLTGVTLAQNDVFTDAQAQLLDAVVPVTGPVLAQLQTALDTALAPFDAAALVISAGAIQSDCTAALTSASGSATLAGAGAFLRFPTAAGQPDIPLATFPANPPPNTQIVTDLDVVLNALVSAVQTSLNTSAASGPLQPLLGPIATALGVPLATIQEQLITGAVGQVSDQLQPLSENVLSGTLNKQTSTAPSQITVTALELNVLPVVAQQLGGALLSTQIGRSTCGPSGRLVAPAAATAPQPTKSAPKRDDPQQVPTSVPAGYESAPLANAPLGPLALAGLGGLLVVSVATGAAVYRRHSRT